MTETPWIMSKAQAEKRLAFLWRVTTLLVHLPEEGEEELKDQINQFLTRVQLFINESREALEIPYLKEAEKMEVEVTVANLLAPLQRLRADLPENPVTTVLKECFTVAVIQAFGLQRYAFLMEENSDPPEA